MLAYHTLHTPHQTSDPAFWESDPYLRQHVAQINAAGRYVASQQRFHVLDMEAMALQLSKASIMIDRTHPGPDFMMQARSESRPRPLLSCQDIRVMERGIRAEIRDPLLNLFLPGCSGGVRV